MNRRVLIVAYYFPPLGMAGVRRPLALFKNLPEYGYSADILTVKDIAYFVREPELLDGLDQSRIFRANSFDPQRLMYLLGKRTVTPTTAQTARKMSGQFFPDSKRGWIRPAVRLGRTLFDNYRYEAVISTSPPISAHSVAMKLAREFKVPWLADFRDYWSVKKIEDTYQTGQQITKGNDLRSRIVNQANEVVGAWPAILEYLNRGELIRNGFDAQRARGWSATPSTDRYVIAVPGNQIDSSKLQPLWSLLKKLIADNLELTSRLTILQVGLADPEKFGSELKALAPEIELECAGYLRGDDYITKLSQCAAFYMGLDDEMAHTVIPSRLFELLASGRPVLAHCAPDGALAKLIEQHSCGVAFDERSVDSAATRLSQMISEHRTSGLRFSPMPEFVSQYTTNRMAKNFASILDRML